MRCAQIGTLVVVATACKDGAPHGEPVRRDPVAERAAAWSATSPPPARACQSDGDCGVFPVVPGDDPCCDVTVTALPMNVRFMQANTEWRKRNCAGVECAPNALPGAQPASCAFTPRCAAGTCADACNEVPAPTAMSAMPAGSPGRLDCKVDDDCMVVGWAPSIKNPCCDGSPIPTPVSRAYVQAVQMWRALGCKEVACPARDTSTFSLDECATTPRCLKRKCADACGP
jgi:hypothetical protein